MHDDLCITFPGIGNRLVLLHGWGADAEDLIPLGKQLSKINGNSIELLSLHAPQLHPEGYGRQWYGLFPHDWDAVPLAINELTERLRSISSNSSIPLEKTILLGFSQGGAMALSVASHLSLAGLICCSAFPHPGWTPNKGMPPVLLTHGTEDNIVPYQAASKLIELFSNKSIDAQLLSFKGDHQIPNTLLPSFRNAIEKWCLV